MQYVYKIHSLVDDKLEHQRLDRLFETVNLPLETQEQLRKSSSILSNRPSIQVVQKRWQLCEEKPFSDSSVWRVLFAFVMLIDTDEDHQKRRDSIHSWIHALCEILTPSLEYTDLSQKLKTLHTFLPNYAYSSREGFIIIALARERMLKHTPTTDDIQKYKESEKSWLKPLWSIYKHNLPAGSCFRLTCS